MPEKRKTTTPKFKSTPVCGHVPIILESTKEDNLYSSLFQLTEDEMKAILGLVELELRPITTWKDPDLIPTPALRKLQTRLRSVLHTIKLSRKKNEENS